MARSPFSIRACAPPGHHSAAMHISGGTRGSTRVHHLFVASSGTALETVTRMIDTPITIARFSGVRTTSVNVRHLCIFIASLRWRPPPSGGHEPIGHRRSVGRSDPCAGQRTKRWFVVSRHWGALYPLRPTQRVLIGPYPCRPVQRSGTERTVGMISPFVAERPYFPPKTGFIGLPDDQSRPRMRLLAGRSVQMLCRPGTSLSLYRRLFGAAVHQPVLKRLQVRAVFPGRRWGRKESP